jgi:hypothetical protein
MVTHPEIDEFRQQMRDLYIPPSDTGFWPAGIRSDDPYRSAVEAALEGDEEGRWFCSVTRHWTLERPDPRGDVH